MLSCAVLHVKAWSCHSTLTEKKYTKIQTHFQIFQSSVAGHLAELDIGERKDRREGQLGAETHMHRSLQDPEQG